MTDRTPVDRFLDWLISMDDPDSPAGLAARREVTLTRIIERAREARGSEPDTCPEMEGDTGIDCQRPAGHPLPHEGWHDGHGNADRTIAIVWSAPVRPTRIVFYQGETTA